MGEKAKKKGKKTSPQSDCEKRLHLKGSSKENYTATQDHGGKDSPEAGSTKKAGVLTVH